MADRVVEAAEQRLSALKAEVEELKLFLATYRKLELWLIVDNPSTAPNPNSQTKFSDPFRAVATPSTKPSVSFRKSGKAEFLATAAIGQIETASRPLPLGELADRLIKSGVEIGGADPRANLSAHLNNSGVLVSIKGHGWWPKGQPYEPAGYDPSAPDTNETTDPGAKLEESAVSVPSTPDDADAARGGDI